MTHLRLTVARLGLGGRPVVGLAILLAATGAAVYLSREPFLAIVLPTVGVVAFALPNPVIALSLYAASIPFEEALVVPVIGTLSRFTGLVLLLSVVLEAVRKQRPPALARLPIAGWILLYYSLASLLWSPDPDVAGFATLLQLVASAWLVAHVIATRSGAFTSVMNWYSVGAVVVSFMGVVDFVRAGSSSSIATLRASAFDDQSVAHFAAYLLPAILYGIVRLVAARRASVAVWFGFVTAVTGAGLLLSGTRSAWLGLAVAVVGVVMPRLGLGRLVRLAVALALVAGIALADPGVRQFLTYRVGSAIETGGAGRTDIWSVGLTLVQEHFLFGAGLRTFPLVFDDEAIARTRSLTEVMASGRAAHNIYLSTLVELGVVGLVALLAWPLGLLRRLWPSRSTLHLAAVAIIVAYLTQGLFLGILYRKYLFLALGLAAGLARRPVRDAE